MLSEQVSRMHRVYTGGSGDRGREGEGGREKKNREERGEREKTEGRWEEKKKERNKWIRTHTFEL